MLGGRLNTTLRPTTCPRCDTPSTVDIHEHGVRWRECRHIRPIPPLHRAPAERDDCRICTPPQLTTAASAA